MKFYYYDHTPQEYEPPGFVPLLADSDDQFSSTPFELDFGTANTYFHCINVRVKTVCDAPQQFSIPSFSQPPAGNTTEAFPSADEAKHVQPNCTKPSQSPELMQLKDCYSLNPHIEPPSKVITPTLPSLQCSAIENNVVDDPIVSNEDGCESEAPHRISSPTGNESISCSCGCNENDLSMICCDSCKTWQHTVCAGYYTNADKRLKGIDYVCLKCKYAAYPSLTPFLINISSIRRALYVIYHEGIKNTKDFGDSLGFEYRKSRDIVRRLISEKFIERVDACETDPNAYRHNSKFFKFVVQHNSDVKKSLKRYFNQDLSSFTAFRRCFKASGPKKSQESLMENILSTPAAQNKRPLEPEQGSEREQKRKVSFSESRKL